MAVQDSTLVPCPFCGQTVELYVDPGTEGEFTQDCELCCHPWHVWVHREQTGNIYVEVGRED